MTGTPLPKKLGIKPGARVLLVGAPRGFERNLGKLPPDVALCEGSAGEPPYDVIVFFTSRKGELARRFGGLARRLAPAGGLWVGWPKQSSSIETDLSDSLVRDIGLAAGLVDNKVCAIDETWSALRFVIRAEDRGRRARVHRS